MGQTIMGIERGRRDSTPSPRRSREVRISNRPVGVMGASLLNLKLTVTWMSETTGRQSCSHDGAVSSFEFALPSGRRAPVSISSTFRALAFRLCRKSQGNGCLRRKQKEGKRVLQIQFDRRIRMA